MSESFSDRVKKGNIAIVDDEKDLLFVYRKALELHNFKVVAFDNPLLALNEFRENHEKYYLVITDVRMPEVSGFQLINEIKSIDPLIKVCLISAYDISDLELSENIDKGIEIEGSFRKPIALIDLINVIKKILENDETKLIYR